MINLDAEMRHWIACALIENPTSNRRVSQEEWDAVHARPSLSHKQVAADLGITYERVRTIRRLERPADDFIAPAHADIALRAGCTVWQVVGVYKDLLALQDGNRPENGASFI